MGAEESALKAQRARQGTVKMLPWECEENQSIVAEDLMEKVREARVCSGPKKHNYFTEHFYQFFGFYSEVY